MYVDLGPPTGTLLVTNVNFNPLFLIKFPFFKNLYKMQEYRVKQVLRGHTDRVNSVSWIPNTSGSCAAAHHLFYSFIFLHLVAACSLQ